MRRRKQRGCALLLAAAAVVTSGLTPAYGIVVSWTGLGGSSNWNVAANWTSSPSLPGPTDDVVNTLSFATINHNAGDDTINSFNSVGTFSVTGGTLSANTAGVGTLQIHNLFTMNGGYLRGFVINPGVGGQGVTVLNNSNNFFDNITSNASIAFSTPGTLRIINGLTLNSTLTFGSGSVFAFQDTQTLGGSGTIIFGDTSTSNRLSIDSTSAATLTIGNNILVRGNTGVIGVAVFNSNASKVINNGTISADVSGGTITLQPASTAVDSFLNNNLVEARNGGAIVLSSNITNGAVGHIDVATTSKVSQNGIRITGGTINVTAGGTFAPINNSNNFLDNVVLNGDLNLITVTGLERIANGLTLNGTGTIGAGSVFAFQDSQVLLGNGTLVFGPGASNRISIDGASPAAALTISSNITIRGQNGTIGPAVFQSTSGTLINNGTISADVSGGLITLQPSSTAVDSILNNRLIEARNGGSILLSANVTNNGTGHLDVAGGSRMTQNGIRIAGGVVNVAAGGDFVPVNNANNFLDSVLFNGNLNMSATSSEQITTGLILNGTASINGGSALGFRGTQTLNGNAIIEFGGSASNRLSIDGTGSATLTLSPSVVIHGQNGAIGASAFAGATTKLINTGLISADVGPGSIILQTSSTAADSILNAGIIEARNGGTILINAPITNTGNGRLDILNISRMTQNGVRITGGTINVATGGNFTPINSNNNILDNVFFLGTMNLFSTSVERIFTGITLNGNVNLDSNSILSFQETQTLNGTATLLFGASASNRLSIDGAGVATTLTLGANVFVRGQNASIGASAVQGTTTKLINNGTIAVDVAGGSFTFVTSSSANDSVLNNRLIAARNGGMIQFNANVTNAGAGHLDVDNLSRLHQNGIRITAGTINVAAGGSFTMTNANSNILDNVTVNGDINMSTISVERIFTGLTLNGIATLNNNSILSFQESQALLGNANIVLGGTTTANRISIDGTAPTTLTLTPTVVIHGQNGSIGASAIQGTPTKLVNNGLISCDVSGGSIGLQTSSPAADSVLNNNIIEARNGGTIMLGSNLTNGPFGHIDILPSSRLMQQGIRITGGAINVSGGGSFTTLNNTGDFLDGVTLNGDLNMTALSIERIANGMTLNGNIQIDNGSIVGFQETQALNGTGVIQLGAAANNRVSIDGAAASTTLTLGPSITIRGNGSVGVSALQGTSSKLVNTGVISANLLSGTITLATSSTAADSVLNNGLLEARNGGTLRIQANTTVGAAGSVNIVDSTSQLLLVSAQLAGGRPLTNAGTFALSGSTAGGTIGTLDGAGTTTLTNAGTLNATRVRQSTLALGGGTINITAGGGTVGTSVVGSLSIATASNNSALNLTNHDLIWDYTGASPIGTVRTLLQNGYHGGLWDRAGIVSSSAAASTNPKTSLGYRESSAKFGAGGGVFSGQTVDGTAVLIKYTYGGDSNLDGQVDVTDLGALATSWQTAGIWDQGDFNYDNFVDVSDLGVLATNWQAGVGNPLAPGSFEAAMAAVGLGAVNVPEPVAISLAAVLLSFGRHRRRRERKLSTRRCGCGS